MDFNCKYKLILQEYFIHLQSEKQFNLKIHLLYFKLKLKGSTNNLNFYHLIEFLIHSKNQILIECLLILCYKLYHLIKLFHFFNYFFI